MLLFHGKFFNCVIGNTNLKVSNNRKGILLEKQYVKWALKHLHANLQTKTDIVQKKLDQASFQSLGFKRSKRFVNEQAVI